MSEPKRLHPFTIFFRIYRFWKRYILLVILLFSYGIFVNPQHLWLSVGITLFLILFSIFRGYFIWYTQKYQIVENEFRYESGIWNKKKVHIPTARIQTVSTVQPFLYRLFGVIRVYIETAGARKPEVTLYGVSSIEADRLKHTLVSSAEEKKKEQKLQEKRMISFYELWWLGITTLEMGIVFAVIGSIFTWAERLFLRRELEQGWVEPLLSSLTIGWTIILFILLTWFFSIFYSFFRYAGFQIKKGDTHIQISQGIFNKKRISIPLQKIQAIRIVESWLRQPFGRVSLHIESAGLQEKRKKKVLFPILKKEEVPRFLQQFVPEFADLVHTEITPLPKRVWHRIALYRLIIPIIGVFVCILYFPSWGYYTLISLPLDFLYNHLCYLDGGFAETRQGIVLRSRRLQKETVLIVKRAIQSKTVIQTPFARKAQLARWQTYLASGNRFTSEWIEQAQAEGRVCSKNVTNGQRGS